MKLCGWKTRSMFDRYNIINEEDLAQGVAQRFNGKTSGKHRAFHRRPGLCNFQPQQFLGP